LTAAYTKIDRITVQLPSQAQSTCKWIDTSAGGSEPVDLEMIDFSTPIPKLQIDNFYYPQALQITCRPGAAARVSFEPASAAFYRSDEIGRVRWGIFIVGGLIWIAACFRLAQLLW
jgi:hypothetical protein